MENNTSIEKKGVVAYVRKSSEENKEGEAKKQLNSMEYQKRFVDETIKRYGLKLLHSPFEDKKSGYEAFQRDGFQEMLNYIEEHKTRLTESYAQK